MFTQVQMAILFPYSSDTGHLSAIPWFHNKLRQDLISNTKKEILRTSYRLISDKFGKSIKITKTIRTHLRVLQKGLKINRSCLLYLPW
jgi:hypothetical protein